MTKRERERRERLLPGGKPRYIRVYDNFGETADRYTVVFNYAGKMPGAKNEPRVVIPVLYMSGAPFHPQGVGMHDEWDRYYDAPEGWTTQVGRKNRHVPSMGRRITFDELPEDCQRLVMGDYKELWRLGDEQE